MGVGVSLLLDDAAEVVNRQGFLQNDGRGGPVKGFDCGTLLWTSVLFHQGSSISQNQGQITTSDQRDCFKDSGLN